MNTIKKHFIPNLGTAIILVFFLLVQTVKAGQSVKSYTPAATTTMISYQGILTDKNGTPINGNVEMVFKLYHQATGGTAFWTESHIGTQAVAVNNGQFQVLLGSLNALNSAAVAGDLYLGITVNGEEMAQREILTSVPHAMQASILTDNAQTLGNVNANNHSILNIAGLYAPSRGSIYIAADTQSYSNGWPKGGMIWLNSVNHSTAAFQGSVRVDIVKDLATNNSPFFDIHRLQSDGNAKQILLMDENGNLSNSGQITSGGNLIINGADLYFGNLPGRGDGGRALVHDTNDALVVNYGNDFSGGVHLGGSVTCGALVEDNLQTPQEKVAGKIDRFEEGDVLCWQDNQLEKCDVSNNPLVQAVADYNGKPIVIGAELIKVIGPVNTGDLLVASDVVGYAMVNNNPLPGTVIAQALEDFDGETGFIRAMIRKF